MTALEAVRELRGQVSVTLLCDALGVAPSTWYRSEQRAQMQRLGEPVEPEKPVARRPPPNALSQQERTQIREVLDSERYADKAIPQVHADLLEKGQYLASTSTMYRILREHDEVRERRNQSRHPARTAPMLCATRPNMLYSWDITKMRGRGKFNIFIMLSSEDETANFWFVL